VAFTTQEGTGGAPWTFQGTPEADSIAVISGSTGNSVAFDFIAEGFEGNDTINFNGTRSVTIKGGQGADLITNNIAASAGLASIITTSFINGNDGDDTIGNNQLGLLATLSTVGGGQGADKLYTTFLQSSKVNGNLGDDFLSVGTVFDDVAPELDNQANFNSSSIFGGQGVDKIRVNSAVGFSNNLVAGQDGNDFIQIELGSFNFTAATATPFDPSNGVTGVSGSSSSTFSGGDGDDIIDASGLLLDISSSGRVEIDSRGRGAASGAELRIVGDDGDDSIFGGVNEDTIDGGANDDWLAGYGGRDTIFGGTGDDVVIGAYFDGELSVGTIGDGAGDTLSGGTGSNRFYVPGTGAPRAIGGLGFATNGVGSTSNIIVTDQEGSTAASAAISNGDLITVAFGADVITDWTSGAGNNVLDTGLGDNLRVFTPGTAAGIAAMSLGADYNNATTTANNFAVRGFYTERVNEVGQFVVNQSGPDIAVWTNYSGTAFGTSASPFGSSVNNFTVLKGVGTSVTVTANEFVAV